MRLLQSTVFLLSLATIIGSSSHLHADPLRSDRSLQFQTPARSESHFVVKLIFDDMKYLAGQKDFVYVLGGLSLSPTIFRSSFRREDPEVTDWWGQSKFADGFFESGEIVGEAVFPVSASVLLWTTGKISGSGRLREFGSDLFRVQAINGLLTGVMKGAVKRTRPNGGSYSYPSGHASSAFATAGVVYRHFGKVWGMAAFALATHVGLSRLQENKHYLTDVIAGGILGSVVSLKLARRRERSSHVLISPYVGDQQYGLNATVRF